MNNSNKFIFDWREGAYFRGFYRIFPNFKKNLVSIASAIFTIGFLSFELYPGSSVSMNGGGVG